MKTDKFNRKVLYNSIINNTKLNLPDISSSTKPVSKNTIKKNNKIEYKFMKNLNNLN